jgi:hypothetical protein
MKELIRKILREEVSRRYTKSNPNIEKTIIRHMDKLMSQTTRVIPPLEENYGMFIEEWCKGGNAVIEARYHMDDETDEFFSGDLFVDNKEIDFLSNVLQVRKAYILNVITEWYDDNYASKFGDEVNHPEFEIFETFETDANRKCYEMVDTDKLSREEIVDYLDFQTLKRRSELEQLSDDELSKTYRSVYNARNNGIGVRN